MKIRSAATLARDKSKHCLNIGTGSVFVLLPCIFNAEVLSQSS